MGYESYAVFQQQKRVYEEGNRMGQNLDKQTVRELAQDWIGASIEKPEPGEVINREWLAEQLRAAGDDITDDDVEAVASEIERIANS